MGRRVLAVAMERMADDPVLLLEGPRSVGKSTLLREIADLRGARILDLDDVATRDAVAADPGTMIAGDQPVCIDEYQKAPVVLDAIKAELNRGATPGRFVLTGSTRHDSLPPGDRQVERTRDRQAANPRHNGCESASLIRCPVCPISNPPLV